MKVEDLGGGEEKVSDVFEVRDLALWFVMSSGFYIRDPRQSDLFSRFVFGGENAFLKESGGVGHDAFDE